MGKENKQIGRRCAGTKTSTRKTWCGVENDGVDTLSVRKGLPGSKRLDQSPKLVCHTFQILLCVVLLVHYIFSLNHTERSGG